MRLKYNVLLPLLLAQSLCASVNAHQKGTDHEHNLFDLDLAELLQVKITGVTNVETSHLFTPASANVFSRNTLDFTGLDSLQELIPSIPGFHIAQNDDSVSPSISARGRRISSAGREILVLVDGNRIDNWYTGGAGISAANISLRNVKRIEAVRGAMSALYGSNAFTGVINIVTDHRLNDIQATLGTDGLYSVEANLSDQWADYEHALFVAATVDEGETRSISNLAGRDQTLDLGSKSIQVSYQGHLGDWSFHSQYFRTEADDYFSGGALSEGNNDQYTETLNVSIRHSKEWSETFSSEIQGGRREFDSFFEGDNVPAFTLRAFNLPDFNSPFRVRSVDNSETEYWFNWKNIWQATSWMNNQVGIEWRDIDKSALRVLSNFDTSIFSLDNLSPRAFDFDLTNNEIPPLVFENEWIPDSQESLFSVFGQSIISLGEKTQLTLGVRHDDYDLAGGKTTSRAALVHEVASDSAIKFIYGEAFRAPTSSEYFFQNNPVVQGNPELNPETVATHEVVWLTKKPRYQFQFTYFSSDYDETIIQPVMNGTRFTLNAGKENISGIESDFAIKLSPEFTTRLAGSHLIHESENEFRQPKNQLTASFSFKKHDWAAYYQAQFIGSRDSVPPTSRTPVEIDSFVKHNIKLSYFPQENLELRFDLSNLTDEDIEDPSSNDQENSVFRAGRRVEFVLNYKFNH